jgi:hypothetical protein
MKLEVDAREVLFKGLLANMSAYNDKMEEQAAVIKAQAVRLDELAALVAGHGKFAALLFLMPDTC